MIGEETESEMDEKVIPIVTIESNPFWKKNAEKIVGESISSMEDTAKQFITITGLLQGIYFHAIAFSDMKNVSSNSTLIYVAPLVLWFLSLFFALLMIFRKRYRININSNRDSKEKFEKIVVWKYRLLSVSGLFLILSFVALILAFLHYLGIV